MRRHHKSDANGFCLQAVCDLVGPRKWGVPQNCHPQTKLVQFLFPFLHFTLVKFILSFLVIVLYDNGGQKEKRQNPQPKTFFVLLLKRCAVSYTGQMLNSHHSWVEDADTVQCSFSLVAVYKLRWNINHLGQLSPAQKDPLEGIQLNSAEKQIFCNSCQQSWLSFSSHCATVTEQELLQHGMVKAVLMRTGTFLKSSLSINLFPNLLG